MDQIEVLSVSHKPFLLFHYSVLICLIRLFLRDDRLHAS